MNASAKYPGLSLIIILFLIFSFEKIYSNPGPDSLKYFGHSFVQIITSEGKNIYIDPYGSDQFKDSADVVLITHEHYDHNEINRVKLKKTCTVIRSANALKSGVYQNFTIGNIKVTAVPAYNSHHDKNSCVGYVIEFDGIKLYHAGDTGKISEMADLAVQNIDYALLPIDGIYTMTPEEATEAAAIIGAKYNIPIHTMPPPDTYSDANVAKFTPPNKLVVKPGTAIELNVTVAAVGSESNIPKDFQLEQNYPNPFNPSTAINFNIPAVDAPSFVEVHVTLKVYDLLGREVKTLVNEYKSPGNYSVQFNAAGLPSGVYLYTLSAGAYSSTKKLMLLK